MKKILVIRFSSFGDVLQGLSVVGALAQGFPKAEIHWATRVEFVSLIERHPDVKKVWGLDRQVGVKGLFQLGQQLRQQGYTHVYDAHNNLRSRILSWFLLGFLSWKRWSGKVSFLRRPVYRFKRLLLFRFRKNYFRQPFNGQRDLLAPLQKWGISEEAPPAPQLFLPSSAWTPAFLNEKKQHKIKNWLKNKKCLIALAPSAAFPLKRWPLESWKDLIQRCASYHFVVLGGREDHFLAELELVDPERVCNLAGELSLLESSAMVSQCQALVSNDTGLMHVAEQLGLPCVALMGPAPFGFPSRPTTKILQLNLFCRPCSKHGQGPCINKEYQKCLVGISSKTVEQELKTMVAMDPANLNEERGYRGTSTS